MIMGLASLQFKWQANRLEIQGRADTESKGSLEVEFSPLGWSSVFFLLWLSTDWMRPTYVMKNNILYSKSTGLNINVI